MAGADISVRTSIIAKMGSTIGSVRPWTAKPSVSVMQYATPIKNIATADQCPSRLPDMVQTKQSA